MKQSPFNDTIRYRQDHTDPLTQQAKGRRKERTTQEEEERLRATHHFIREK